MRNSKNILTILLLLIVLSSSIISCKKEETNNQMDQPQVFNSPEEAANKGKSDMLEILKNKSVNLNLDAGLLESSQPGKMIRHIELDFDKLVKTDSVSGLSDLSKEEINTIAPLVTNNKVAGIVEIVNSPKGWTVTGLSNIQTMDDINQIISSSGQNASDINITAFEVPNLQIMIYGVSKNDTMVYYMNYGESNFEEGKQLSEIYSQIKAEAVMFNKNYGELIRKQKLVK